MLRESKSTTAKEISAMSLCKKTEFSTSRFHKFVPMIIERYKKNHVPGLQKNFKFIASSDMTISQLVSILRQKMKVRPHQSYHLLYSKGRRAVMMSERLGEISSEYRDPFGVLCFIFAAQSTFGCPVPRDKPVKSKFPGMEPNPFGAPEPSPWTEENLMAFLEEEEEQYMLPLQDMNAFMNYILNVVPHPEESTDSEAEEPLSSNQPPILLPQVFLPPNQVSQVAHNYTQTEPESASNSNSQSTSTPNAASGSVLEPLPLTLLIQELDHFVPFWHIQFMPIPGLPSSIAAGDSTTLVNALNRLVQALQSHPPNSMGTPVTLPTPVLLNPMYSPISFGPLASQLTTLTSDQASNALALANQVLAALHGESGAQPLPQAATGVTQFTMLGQYFNQVAQNLELQHLVSQTNPPDVLTPLPLVLGVMHDSVSAADLEMLDPFGPSGYGTSEASNWFITDSDSPSEEEVDADYVCDILL